MCNCDLFALYDVMTVRWWFLHILLKSLQTPDSLTDRFINHLRVGNYILVVVEVVGHEEIPRLHAVDDRFELIVGLCPWGCCRRCYGQSFRLPCKLRTSGFRKFYIWFLKHFVLLLVLLKLRRQTYLSPSVLENPMLIRVCFCLSLFL